MEIIGRINKIENAMTKANKSYAKLDVAGTHFNIFYTKDNTHLRDIENGKYKIGDVVKVTYEMNGKYTDFKNIEVSTLPLINSQTPTPQTPSQAPDWAAKDRRIVRQSSHERAGEAINIAISIININLARMDENQMISEVTVFGLARKVAETMIDLSKLFEENAYRESDKQ